MEYKNKTEEIRFIVDVFNTDFHRDLNISRLGGEILNAAEKHAGLRGFGLNDIRRDNHSWVLSRLTIEMEQMPQVYDQCTIETWIENIYRVFTNRNFHITGPQGQTLGYARSIWAMIDNDTRQPVDIAAIYSARFEPFLYAEHPCPIRQHSRLRPLPPTTPIAETVTVRYSDIDYNGHMNSIKYIEHVCNLFPIDYLRDHRLHRIEVAYLAEATHGEALHFYMVEEEPHVYIVEAYKNPSSDPTKSTADSRGTAVLRSRLEFN